MADTPRSVLSVCSGVGGLDVGIAKAFHGAVTRGYIERESYPAVCLVAAMEEGSVAPAPLWLGDLGAFPANGWAGLVDTVAASIPCQGNSVAGARGGLDDPRWLWPQTRRLLRLVRPRYFILENVPGLLTVSDGRSFGGLLGDLDTLGYDAVWGCLSAAQIGASHGRDRLWLLAWRRDVAHAARDHGQGEPRIANGGRPLVGPGPRTGGRIGDGRSAERVPVGVGTHAASSAGLRSRAAAVADTAVRGFSVGQPVSGPPCCWQAAGACRGRCQRDDGAPVGHAERQSLALGRTLRRDVGTECQAAERAGVALPAWPPLPDDTDGWRAVIGVRPDLAPAQPAVRRVAAVRAGDDRLDVRVPCACPRTRRIAAIGNAVCPDQCAAALRGLWHRAFGEMP